MWKWRIEIDSHGYYMCMRVKPRRFQKALFALPCVSICEKPLHRPHFTCLVCRGRRVYQGKMPSRIPVKMYVLYIHKGRRFEKVKDILIKKLMSIAEILAN